MDEEERERERYAVFKPASLSFTSSVLTLKTSKEATKAKSQIEDGQIERRGESERESEGGKWKGMKNACDCNDDVFRSLFPSSLYCVSLGVALSRLGCDTKRRYCLYRFMRDI